MPKKQRNLPVGILAACLAVSVVCNGYQYFSGNPGGGETFREPVQQTDANSRDSYFTIHHVREAQAQVPEQYRPAFNEAIDRAVGQGIVTCFIHCDHPSNILPYSVTPYLGDYSRAPDVNIYHYDYNTIWPDQLRAYQKRTEPPESGDDMPFFSFSSMSPVTAGFVAILKSIDPSLSPAEYKQLLVDTSYPMEYVGVMDWESGTSEHTVDIAKAARTLRDGVAG